jgi:hypothetical protein
MRLFWKKKENREEPISELLISLRSTWEQNTFNMALKKYYQGRNFSSSDINKAGEKYKEIIAYYEPYIIWQKMKPFKEVHYGEWVKYCDNKNIDYDSFKDRDFFYGLLCKKYNRKIYATDIIPDFDDEIDCDKNFLSSFFNEYIWSGDTDKINEYKTILNSFKIKNDELEDLFKDIDYKVILRNLIIEIINESESVIKQADLKNHLDNVSNNEISQACYSLEKFDVIRREKSGSSYILTVL